MQNRIMNTATVVLLIVSVLTAVLFTANTGLHEKAERLAENGDTNVNGMSVLSLIHDTGSLDTTSDEEIMQGQLRLELPANVDSSDVTIENDYLHKQIIVSIPNIDGSYFYDYPMVGKSDNITDLIYDVSGQTGTLNITLDSVYEVETTYSDKYIYLSFVDPHDIYDYIVVVDAGHGGSDQGKTISKVNEDDLNLSIVLKLKALFDSDKANIGVYYTRLDDSRVSLQERAELANALKADLFLSVHNNSTASGRMSTINGTEVMYRVSDESGESKKFAEVCLDELLNNLGSNSKGLVAGDDIYIIRTSEVPVALVEVGFMTNSLELLSLSSDEYQEEAAEALHSAVWKMLWDEGEE